MSEVLRAREANLTGMFYVYRNFICHLALYYYTELAVLVSLKNSLS